MNNVKWMLPVRQSSLTNHDLIHPKAKYHCFNNNVSLCEKYRQSQDFYETDIESGEIAMRPEIACKKCYEIWKKQFNIVC